MDASLAPGFEEPQLVAAVAGPQFAEMSEDAVYTPLPRDYAPDFGTGLRLSPASEEHHLPPVTDSFPKQDEDAERDLDVPAFMRRLQF
jgi:hypothetical protein